jgi:hypothetical protein
MKIEDPLPDFLKTPSTPSKESENDCAVCMYVQVYYFLAKFTRSKEPRLKVFFFCFLMIFKLVYCTWSIVLGLEFHSVKSRLELIISNSA